MSPEMIRSSLHTPQEIGLFYSYSFEMPPELEVHTYISVKLRGVSIAWSACQKSMKRLSDIPQTDEYYSRKGNLFMPLINPFYTNTRPIV